MKILILHLSDIHIKNEHDPALKLGDLIAKKSIEPALNCDLILLAITGDISYSGTKQQFQIATTFINEIKTSIESSSKTPVNVFCCPGNHDCDLSENPVRDILLAKSAETPENIEPSVITECCKVQENYFGFERTITSSPCIHDHPLLKEYIISHKERSISITSINASWCSQKKEQPGKLLYPTKYLNPSNSAADIKIALIHHPLNWYCQGTYHPLRKMLRNKFNIILSGHEHTQGLSEYRDPGNSSLIHIEGGALQPHGRNENPEFAQIILNLSENTIISTHYEIDSSQAEVIKKTEQELTQPNLTAHLQNELQDDFLSILQDPGGKFVHPEKGEVLIDDFYIYPELSDALQNDETSLLSADRLLNDLSSLNKIIIYGDENNGKTTLLRQFFSHYHAQGKTPLYIKAQELKSSATQNLEKETIRIASLQYKNLNFYTETTFENRVALIDDIEKTPGGSKGQNNLITHLEKSFGKIIITGSKSHELSELVDQSIAKTLEDYKQYKIQNFGHNYRHKLIKKWCLCGNIETAQELDSKIHEFESNLNLILGKNLVPSRPIYLMILLQNSTSQHTDLKNSGFAHYYQFLITKGLGEAGANPKELTEIYHYIANLAWFYKSKNVNELELPDLIEFNQTFSAKFTTVNFQDRLALLNNAKILRSNGNFFSFFYPYIFYFFIGKYLADNIHEDEIKALVEDYCRNLDKTESAHSILFLTHHRNEPWVIEKIISTLKSCFSEYSPMTFEKDINQVNSLINSVPELLIGNIDVPENQETYRKHRDIHEAAEVEARDIQHDKDTESEPLKKATLIASQINLAMKTAEILGQVTKNYYGSTGRDAKHLQIEEVFDAPLRLLSIVFNAMEEDPTALLNSISNFIRTNSPHITEDAIDSEARKAAFFILSLVVSGMLTKASSFVSTEKLKEEIHAVIKAKNKNSYNLIGMAYIFGTPGKLPIDKIRALAKDLEKSKFCYSVLQTLALHHMHMYHMSLNDRKQLCSALKISHSLPKTETKKIEAGT